MDFVQYLPPPYMRRSKRINHKVSSETGEKEEKVDGQPEEAVTVESGEISNLLRSISISGAISEGLDQIAEGYNMDKQRINAIKVSCQQLLMILKISSMKMK